MGQKAVFCEKVPFFNFHTLYLDDITSDHFFSDILGGGRPELNTMPPIVGFSDMFFIQNQHLEVLRYGQDRWYNLGDHHPYSTFNGHLFGKPIVFPVLTHLCPKNAFFSPEVDPKIRHTH